MNQDDIIKRRAALTRLALAVRERLPVEKADRDAFFKVYLDDMDRFSTDTFIRACRRLEVAIDWFPKKHELFEACQAMAKWKADNERPQRLALPSGDKPLSPEKLKNFRADVEALIKRRTM